MQNLPILSAQQSHEATPLATSQWADNANLSVSWNDKGVVYLANENVINFDTLGVVNGHHSLIVGGTRAGKGTSFLIPNISLWEGSMFIIDPKGENAMVTARRRGKGSQYCKGMGQDVYLLDPFGVSKRPDDGFEDIQARYNPLDAIDVKEPNAVDMVNALCSAIVTIPSQGESVVWKEAARRLLKATILHVLTSDDISEHERNLVTVYKLLGFGDQEKQEFLRDIGADDVPSAHTLLYRSMAQNRAFNGMVAAEGETYAHMSAEAPKQYLGVIETLKSELEFMDSPSMQDTLSMSDFNLSDFKDSENGISVYLSLPLSMMETHFRWLRMMVTLSLNTFEAQKYQPRSGQPTMMMLDEFASLKYMPQMENGIAQMAGYGVKFVLAVQTLTQLKSQYKDNWETFISNCGVKLFLSNEDIFTRDYASKLVGEAEVKRYTTTQTRGGNQGYSETFTETHSYGTSHGTSFSSGPGLAQFTRGRSSGTNSSSSYAHGEAYSSGSSWSDATQEAIHVRPLVRSSEVGRFFAYVEEPNGLPYAGHSLVLISGFQPFSIKKTLYYRHIRFEGLFDPHPDHPFTPAYRPPLEIIAPQLFKPLLQKPEKKQHWFKRFMRWLLAFLFSMNGVYWFWLPIALAMALLRYLFATGLIVDAAMLLLAFWA